MGGNRKRKENLWKRDPHCHWCGRLTRTEGEQNNDLATVDHLRTKYDPSRWLRGDGQDERTVLACYACNNERARVDTLSRPTEELHRRGKGWRLNPGIFSGNNPASMNEILDTLKLRGIL
jgi:hypothetical protein